VYKIADLLHLLENTFDRKRISAISNPKPNPNQGQRQSKISGGGKTKKLKPIMVIISVICGIRNEA